MEYGKLVRNNIPRIIMERGGHPVTRKLSDTEYTEALRQKLSEETAEFLESGSLEEICDMFEVLYAILDDMGVSASEAEIVRMKKATERGAFKDRIYLERVEQADED